MPGFLSVCVCVCMIFGWLFCFVSLVNCQQYKKDYNPGVGTQLLGILKHETNGCSQPKQATLLIYPD